MNRVRVSTTVDPQLLDAARGLVAGSDAVVIDAALQALVAQRRSAEIDAAYAKAYADQPLDMADEWGDLASFSDAVSRS